MSDSFLTLRPRSYASPIGRHSSSTLQSIKDGQSCHSLFVDNQSTSSAVSLARIGWRALDVEEGDSRIRCIAYVITSVSEGLASGAGVFFAKKEAMDLLDDLAAWYGREKGNVWSFTMHTFTKVPASECPWESPTHCGHSDPNENAPDKYNLCKRRLSQNKAEHVGPIV